jgi:cytochrome c5
MSDKEEDFSRVFIWVLAILVLFTIVVVLVARSIGMNENSGPMTDKDIDERTKPYSTVKVAGVDEATSSEAKTEPAPADQPAPAEPAAPAMEATAPAMAAPAESVAAIDGQSLYPACAACHSTGAAGAPKVGDAAAWGPRAAAGIDAMTTSAINGKGAMPPRGGRMDLDDAQIRAIVEYMVNASS